MRSRNLKMWLGLWLAVWTLGTGLSTSSGQEPQRSPVQPIRTTVARPPGCAAPRRIIREGRQAVGDREASWQELRMLQADVLRLEHEFQQFAKSLQGGRSSVDPQRLQEIEQQVAQLESSFGRQLTRLEDVFASQANLRRLEGDLAKLKDRPECPGPEQIQKLDRRISKLETIIHQLVTHIKSQAKAESEKRKAEPSEPSTLNRQPSTNPPSGSAEPTEVRAGQQNSGDEQPGWLRRWLSPLARLVGTAYAGPLGGAIATGAVGLAGWFLFGRKRSPRSSGQSAGNEIERYPSAHAPVANQQQSGRSLESIYRGDVVSRDGSSQRVEPEPDSDLYREAVMRAAGGHLDVLGSKIVGLELLNWVARRFASDHKQI